MEEETTSKTMQPRETHHFFYFCVMIGLCISATLIYTTNLKSPSSSFEMNLCFNCGDKRAKMPLVRTSKTPPQDYVVQTEGCTIPDFPLSHPDIVKFTYISVKELVCSDKLPLTEESGLELIFYEERLPEYGTTKYTVNCSYQGIERVTQDRKKYGRDCDSKYRLKEMTPLFQRETTIDDDAVYVTCCDSLDPTNTIYKAVHEFIQPRRAQAKRDKFKAEEDSRREEREKLNVIIMGTDSVSRANLKRHMPKTYEYLTNDLRAVDLQGINKIADNTHPNIVALLMGFSLNELAHHNCKKGTMKKKIFDDCPIIWKDFDREGYVTAYAEDTTHVGTFHHGPFGFVKEPTDYYNRPYQKASEKFTGHGGGIKGAVGHLCLGAKPCNEVIHNYSLAVAEELIDVPYFAYYWTTSVTHDAQEWALRADEPSYNYLKSMKEGGHLNNSILFFISDHGMRTGDFRATYPGRLEERLPFANIVFPPWFRKKYPEAMANMKTNTKKLTSTYDLHATIRDILEHNYRNISISTTKAHRGISLFQEISTKRKCSDAGIPDQYCTCENTKPIDANDHSVKRAAREAVAVLNQGLANFSDCAQLTLNKILKARIRVPRQSTNPKPSNISKKLFIVTFVTEPGGANMEASVERSRNIYKVTGEVLRINRYGNQSHCISDQTFVKYCYCKDLLT